MKIFLLILILFFSTFVFSQKTIEISDDKSSKYFYRSLKKNEKDYKIVSIKNVKEKTIRIWKEGEVFIISKSPYYIKKFKNIKTGKTSFFTQAVNVNLDSLTIDKVKKIKAEYYIDCFPITIEVIDTNCYFEKVIGCNNDVKTLTAKLWTSELKLGIEDFIMKLPSGEYQNGLTTFIINQPINDSTKKSTFYKKIELELLAKNIKIDNPINQPLIFINNKQAYFEDINSLDETKLKSYKIITDKQNLLFGARAEYGVILIETKT